MAGITRFEDLVAWQKARHLAREVYITTNKGLFASDFGLSRQVQRAAVSVMSNIAEGFERKRPREFKYFLTVAKASCAEVRSQLYVASDIGYLSNETFEYLLEIASEAARIIAGLHASIDRNNH